MRPAINRSKGYNRPELQLPEKRLTPGACPVCGLFYVIDSPTDRKLHARNHARVIEILLPNSTPRMRTRLTQAGEATLVDMRSPAWLQREMLSRARRFGRETGWGLMWDVMGEREPGVEGRLIMDDREDQDGSVIVGAACFRWRDYVDAPSAWALQWIWITPAAQRSGIMTRLWPTLKAQYGAFDVERPYSDKMTGALAKVQQAT